MHPDKLIDHITERATDQELRQSQREIIELANKAELFCCETIDELKKLALEHTDLVEPDDE